jgi:hypothetical protein
MRKHWTNEEDSYLINNIKDLSLRELSDKLNRTVGSAKDRTSRILGIRRPSLKEKKPQKNECFGDLTVVNVQSNRGDQYVLCSCLCGKEKDVRIYSLRNGNTTSCGCRLYSIRKKGGNYQTYGWAYKIYKRNAKKQKRRFDIDLEEFKYLTSLNCHYCGSEPRLVNRYSEGNRGKNYQKGTVEIAYAKINGLDRKNNNLGYVPGNCLPCCAICNRAKREMSFEDFNDWISQMVRFNR